MTGKQQDNFTTFTDTLSIGIVQTTQKENDILRMLTLANILNYCKGTEAREWGEIGACQMLQTCSQKKKNFSAANTQLCDYI